MAAAILAAASGTDSLAPAMAPQMSKTAAAAAVVAGTAFVSLPSRPGPSTKAPALRGNAPAGHANATGLSTLGADALEFMIS